MVYLYIFKEHQLPYFKIGIAADPDSRLRTLQTGNSHGITKVGAWPFESRESAKFVESDIHRRHSTARRHGGTEWFQLDDDEIAQLIEWLDQNAWQEAVETDEAMRFVTKVAPWVIGAGMVVFGIAKEVVRSYIKNRRT